MELQPKSVEDIARTISVHGAAPNARLNLQSERKAAADSIQTGTYISWVPHPSCVLGPSAADEIKNGTGQCCRVGSASVCMCGHALSAHKPLLKLKSGYNKPPACASCKRCVGFEYAPQFPEECGQWWLSRRRDFNLAEWRRRVRETPTEYCCIGCEQKVSDHETVFENRQGRLSRGAAVDEAYMPLAAVVKEDAEGEEQQQLQRNLDTIRTHAIPSILHQQQPRQLTAGGRGPVHTTHSSTGTSIACAGGSGGGGSRYGGVEGSETTAQPSHSSQSQTRPHVQIGRK